MKSNIANHFKQKGYLLIETVLALSICIILLPYLYHAHTLIIKKIDHIHNSIQLSYEWYFAYDLIKSDVDHAFKILMNKSSCTIYTFQEIINYKIKNNTLYRYCLEPKSQFCISSKLKGPSFSIEYNALKIKFDNFSSPIIFKINE